MSKTRFYIRLILASGQLFLITSCGLIERLFPASVADGASRLSVESIGMLLKYAADEQHGCGLLSQRAVISEKAELTGLATAKATYAVSNCVLDFGDKTKISEDCLGNETFASGKVTLNAKQIRHGIRTSHEGHYAVIPWPDNQVEFELDVTEFNNYKVWSSNRHESLNIISGKAQANISVNLSRDPSHGFCTIPTPEIRIQHIRYRDARLELPGPFGRFQVAVQDSDIGAQNGTFAGLTNHLSGKMTVWGEEVSVPSDKQGLDPHFEESQHLKGLQCRLGDQSKSPNYQCDAKKELITHAARLLVLNTAMIVKESHAEKVSSNSFLGFGCGFDGMLQKMGTCSVDRLSRVIEVSNCTIGGSAWNLAYEKDCVNEHLYMTGEATVVQGRLRIDEKCYTLSSERTRPDSVTFFLDSVEFANFSTYYLAHGQLAPVGKLLIRNGELKAIIKPIFATNRKIHGQFDVATPVAIFDSLDLSNANVELWLNPAQVAGDDFSVSLNINNSQLYAQNGLFRGKGNYLKGKITVNGELHSIEEVNLNPGFEASAFDISYGCHPDIKDPVPYH